MNAWRRPSLLHNSRFKFFQVKKEINYSLLAEFSFDSKSIFTNVIKIVGFDWVWLNKNWIQKPIRTMRVQRKEIVFRYKAKPKKRVPVNLVMNSTWGRRGGGEVGLDLGSKGYNKVFWLQLSFFKHTLQIQELSTFISRSWQFEWKWEG